MIGNDPYVGPLKGYFAIPDIGDFENPIFDIDLKFAIFALEKIDIRYWIFNFRYWLAENPIFKTGQNRYWILRHLKILYPICDPPFWGSISVNSHFEFVS